MLLSPPCAHEPRIDDGIRDSIRHATRPVTTETARLFPEAFEEHYRIVQPNAAEAAQVVEWLRSVGNKLLAAGDVSIRATISYHLSDSSELSAFVAHAGEEARVVVSKGLLQKLVKNEDMLAAILGHELMHVHFRERFQDDGEGLKITKVEEYVADVASISTWMIKAGYAPHQAVAVFDDLREHTALSEKGEARLLRPWVAFTDEHGLLENRAQAINALIAKEIKERGSVPIAVTPLRGEIKAAVEGCHHVTHVETIKRDPSYKNATPLEKQRRLLDEIREITTATSLRVPELTREFESVLKSAPITSTAIEEVYATLKENRLDAKKEFLLIACRAAQRQGQQGVVPSELREVAKTIRTFVAGRTDHDILEGARRLRDFVTKCKGVDPGVRIAISSSFSSPLVSAEKVPWERQLQLARMMMERGDPDLLYALWMTGAYDTRLIPMASDEALKKFSELPELVSVKQSGGLTLSPSGDWERAAGPETALGAIQGIRYRYQEFVDAAVAERRHRANVATSAVQMDFSQYASLGEAPAEILARNLEAGLSFFSDSIAHPSQTSFHASARWSKQRDEDLMEGADEDEGCPRGVLSG